MTDIEALAKWLADNDKTMLNEYRTHLVKEAFVGGYQAAQAEQAKQEPVGGVFYMPNDKYPKATFNTLDIPNGALLYTSPPNQSALIAELVEFIEDIKLNTVEKWTERTCDVALAKIKDK